MNKPIQFISIDKNGRCQINPEALEMISSINENIAIVCVAGLYRTGKSYLLNRLLGRQDGFEIGPTINSCTKGLWIWGEPILLEDRNLKVLLIDTEGLGSAFEDRNETIDMEIFCLGVLLSSLFIYNSMKNIDENAIESLALVINFAKKIQSSFKDLDSYSNNFPSFLWVIRDFALDLVDASGKKLTSSQYLENALKMHEDSIDEESIRKNEIRKLLQLFFKERDCFTLIRPVNDEKKLRLIDQLPVGEIRPEFLSQMQELVSRVYNGIRPKLIQGSFVNGKTYLEIVKMYVDALNNNSIPDVKTSWKLVVESQMEQIFEKSLNYYTEEMLQLDFRNEIQTIEDMLKHHNKHKLIAFDYLREYSNINVPCLVYIDFMNKFENQIDEHFKDFVSKWHEVKRKDCEQLCEKIIKTFNETKSNEDVFSILDSFEDVINYINTSIKNDKKHELITPKMIETVTLKLKKGFKSEKMKLESDIGILKHEKTVLQTQLDKTKDNYEKLKSENESIINDLKEQILNLKLEYESKIDEKNKMLRNVEFSNQNLVGELKDKITLMNQIIENKDKEIKNLMEINSNKEKKAKKKESVIDDGAFDGKIAHIIHSIDSYQDILVKTELEKAKLQIKLEINQRIDDMEEEFMKKLVQSKKICEKTIMKLKNAHSEEISSLKQLIKELYDEINDYKCQVSSQDYKIELYKEKIITYEKDKKAQTDHANLLSTLAFKLNNYINSIEKK